MCKRRRRSGNDRLQGAGRIHALHFREETNPAFLLKEVDCRIAAIGFDGDDRANTAVRNRAPLVSRCRHRGPDSDEADETIPAGTKEEVFPGVKPTISTFT